MSRLFNPKIIEQDRQNEDAASNLATLSIKDIYPDPQNDHIYDVDEERDQALAESVREHGILQPLLLRPHPAIPGKFMIVSGHRRHRAALANNLTTVPVMVFQATGEKTDTIRSKIQFFESNALTRQTTVQENLEMIIELEKAYALLRGADESLKGIPTRELIAKSMGMSERQVADYMTVKNGMSDDDWTDWHDGKLSLNEALKRVKEEKEIANEDPESVEEEIEDNSQKQEKSKKSDKPLLVLRNDQERKDFLDTWASWKVLCRVPKLNLVVREYILPDDSCIYSYDFGEIEKSCWWESSGKAARRIEHKQLLHPGDNVTPDFTSTTLLIAHLRDVVPNK
jgi:ParB/RepB/Spo0J family partition protein